MAAPTLDVPGTAACQACHSGPTVSRTTLDDIKSLYRWFRSNRGPLFQEWEAGSLTMDDDDCMPSFRRLLKTLDGTERDVRRIDIFGGAASVVEVMTMFRQYRRLRRAVARETAAAQHAWQEGTGG